MHTKIFHSAYQDAENQPITYRVEYHESSDIPADPFELARKEAAHDALHCEAALLVYRPVSTSNNLSKRLMWREYLIHYGVTCGRLAMFPDDEQPKENDTKMPEQVSAFLRRLLHEIGDRGTRLGIWTVAYPRVVPGHGTEGMSFQDQDAVSICGDGLFVLKFRPSEDYREHGEDGWEFSLAYAGWDGEGAFTTTNDDDELLRAILDRVAYRDSRDIRDIRGNDFAVQCNHCHSEYRWRDDGVIYRPLPDGCEIDDMPDNSKCCATLLNAELDDEDDTAEDDTDILAYVATSDRAVGPILRPRTFADLVVSTTDILVVHTDPNRPSRHLEGGPSVHIHKLTLASPKSGWSAFVVRPTGNVRDHDDAKRHPLVDGVSFEKALKAAETFMLSQDVLAEVGVF